MLKRRLPDAVHTLAMLVCLVPGVIFAQQTIHVPADQPTIQAAINAAADGDTVLVAPNTYYEHLDFLSKAITVVSSDGAATTILDGSMTGTVAFLGTPAGKAAAVLSGFTVQHGKGEATHPPYPGIDYGGGVVIVGNATLLNSTVENNSTCNVEIVAGGDVTVHGNHVLQSQSTADYGGGCHTNPDGIAVHDGPNDQLHPIHIDDNIIENNLLSGVETYQVVEPVFITHNLISGNSGAMGIRIGEASDTVIADNVITGNGYDGLLSQTNASMTVVNNTFYANGVSNADDGEASEVDVASVGNIQLVNNIIVGIYKDVPPLGCSSPADASQLPLIWDHNLIYNTMTKTGSIPCTGSPGNDNLFVDPQFGSALTGDLHLTTGSPAIDAGTDSAPYLDSTDYDGNPRIQDATGKGYGIVDMGAYEFPGVVAAAPTQLVLVAAQNTIQPGQSVPLVATAASTLGTPTGSVTLYVDGVPFQTATLSGGSANFTSAALKPGYHALYATYPGQGVFSPATSVLIYVSVAKYTPSLTLASSTNPSALGQAVTFTATISSPDGAILSPIALADGKNPAVSLTSDANGVATYTTSSLTLGNHNMNATFPGDATHDPAYAMTVMQQVITPYVTTTLISSSLNPSTLGQAVTFTAQVSSANGALTGGMQFAVDGVMLATVPLDATQFAAYTTSTLSAVSHSVTAIYVPSSSSGLFAGSSATMTQVVNALGSATVLSAMPLSATFGASVMLQAAVTASPASTDVPGGKVMFYNGGVSLGSVQIAGGVAVLSVTSLPVGTDTITAVYAGDTNFAGSNSNAVQVVILAPTALRLTSDVNPVGLGQFVTFTATASSSAGNTPAGTVTFFDGATAIGVSALTAGAAKLTTNSMALGAHSITAQLIPASGFAASTSAVFEETVVPYDFSLTTATPSVMIQTGHRGSMTLEVASLGVFGGSVAFSCDSTVPPYVTCLFPDAPVTLAVGGKASTTLVIDTDTILDFYAGRRDASAERLILAMLFPVSLLGFVRRRTLVSRVLLLACVALAASGLTACANRYPNATPPGTYVIPVTAKGDTLIHTVSITLNVTQ